MTTTRRFVGPVLLTATLLLALSLPGAAQVRAGLLNIVSQTTGTLTVARGGSGATSLTGVVIGNGTSAFTVVAAPLGTIVGTTDSQTLTSKTLTTPTIASFANATHTHQNSAGGGQLALAAFSSVTGSGAVVGASSPTLVTPTLGVASGTALALTPAGTVYDTLRVNHSDGTPRVRGGVFASNTAYGGLWFGNVTPSDSNYVLLSNGANTLVNAALGGTLDLRIGHSTVLVLSANRVEQRNTTNAQRLDIANTYTSSTDREDFSILWSGNVAYFGATKGTVGGTARAASWFYGGTTAPGTPAITVPATSGAVVIAGGVTSNGPVAVSQGVITAQAPILDLSTTWNNAAVTFSALRLNVTNTASDFFSDFAAFAIDGTTKVRFLKNGNFQARAYLSTDTIGTIDATKNVEVNGADAVAYLGSAVKLAWGNGSDLYTSDTGISRNTAGVVEVNSGTAGTFRDLKMRNVVGQTGYSEMAEMSAPGAGAANTVRLYAEDNGSGKTRLCAIFPTGAAQCFAVEP